MQQEDEDYEEGGGDEEEEWEGDAHVPGLSIRKQRRNPVCESTTPRAKRPRQALLLHYVSSLFYLPSLPEYQVYSSRCDAMLCDLYCTNSYPAPCYAMPCHAMSYYTALHWWRIIVTPHHVHHTVLYCTIHRRRFCHHPPVLNSLLYMRKRKWCYLPCALWVRWCLCRQLRASAACRASQTISAGRLMPRGAVGEALWRTAIGAQ